MKGRIAAGRGIVSQRVELLTERIGFQGSDLCSELKTWNYGFNCVAG